ncbi:MAG: ShlB/FhaC/HecB family hemolysin secretion/activation protein [Rhodoferax sp.]|nr:ShlB/FhaC/HecB family hemolysin secretion/activation protein [Rhodoferax sp.]
MPINTPKNFRFQVVFLAALLSQSAWSQTQPPEPTLDVTRYVVEGDSPLTAEETTLLLAPFIGEKRKLSDIEAAAGALESAMRERGFSFHRMFVPVQKPVAGEIRLQVIGIKVSHVEVTGNEHFSSDNIRRSLSNLVEGEVPEVRTLGRDITAGNNNPAKQVTVTFKESAEAGKVDAVVRVKDSPVLVFFAGMSGNQALSDRNTDQNTYRITGGVQHANLFDRDHVATLSYTTDPRNTSDVSLFGAYYQVPFYGTGINLSAYYTQSDISSGTVQQGAGVFEVSGSGKFLGVRLARALPRINTLQQTVALALDDRLFVNKTTFNGATIQPDVGSRVLSLQYLFRNEPTWGEIAGGIEYLANLSGGANNNEADHAANGGTKDWNAWRFSLELSKETSAWSYTGRLKGQYADQALISGEQFGLGGTNSVRGFADRVVSGERGYQWNLEAKGPNLGGLQLRPVIFADGGTVHARLTGISETISSAGVGLRFAHRNLQVAADIARVIDSESTQTGGNPSRLHLGLSYRF